jgi:hypothetical protein
MAFVEIASLVTRSAQRLDQLFVRGDIVGSKLSCEGVETISKQNRNVGCLVTVLGVTSETGAAND